MPWIWAALMPHPPIIVPEVGHGREKEAAETLRGVALLTEKLSALRPDHLLLLSPHQHYALRALSLNESEALKGSFEAFGVPSVGFELHTPPDAVGALARHLAEAGIGVRREKFSNLSRDQGSMVPLYWLNRSWQGLPPVVLGSPVGLEPRTAFELGRALQTFDDGSRWALLASGDLSHRLTPDAPAGYSPFGKTFDARVVEALTLNTPRSLLALSPEEREAAGECGLASVMALLGFCKGEAGAIEVLSYEGPFGVGYCNAVWMGPQAGNEGRDE